MNHPHEVTSADSNDYVILHARRHNLNYHWDAQVILRTLVYEVGVVLLIKMLLFKTNENCDIQFCNSVLWRIANSRSSKRCDNQLAFMSWSTGPISQMKKKKTYWSTKRKVGYHLLRTNSKGLVFIVNYDYYNILISNL